MPTIRHLQQRRDELQKQYDQLSTLIQKLGERLVVETDPVVESKLLLHKDLLDTKRASIDEQIEDLDVQIETLARRGLRIETSVDPKFQLEQQPQEKEASLTLLDDRIDEIEQTPAKLKPNEEHSVAFKDPSTSRQPETTSSKIPTQLDALKEPTKPLYTLREHLKPITAVAISSDRKILASGSADGIIKLQDPSTGECRQHLQYIPSKVLYIAISPDKKVMATGHAYYVTGFINLWDLETGQPCLLEGHTEAVIALAFRTDDGTLISGSTDKTIRQWDIENLESVGVPIDLDYIKALAISADGKFAGVIDNRTIRLWNLVTQQPYPTLNIDTTKAKSLAIKTEGNMLALGNNDGTISLWNRESKREVATSKKIDIWKPFKNLAGQANSILCIAFSPDGQTIVSGKKNGTIEIWDIGNFLSD